MSSAPEIASCLDLTRVLDEDLPIYASEAYGDPPFEMQTWCTVAGQGFKVSRLVLGTQTGTHLDAPAHFVAGGAELEDLPVEALMGPYYWLDLAQADGLQRDRLLSSYRGEAILFLTSSVRADATLSEATLDAMLALPCRVWVTVYGMQVAGREPLHFHRALAQAGKYLVEDLDGSMARHVQPGGEIVALPLRLGHASGAPCRVVVRPRTLTEREE